MGTSRRQFFQVMAGGLVAASGVGGRVRPVTAQGPTVKIGTAVLGDFSLIAPIVIALEKGYFRAQGVSAEFQPLRGGPDLVKAVVAGQIQIGATGATDVPVFRATGVPIRFIASQVDGNHFTLNVTQAVNQLADLKGKSIGVTRVGASTWIFATMLAKQQGWVPEKDVTIVGLGGLDAQLAALSRGEIAAFIWGDGGAVTELQGKSKILLRLDTVTPKWISQGYYATDEYIKGNKDAISRALKALFQSARFIGENPREAAAIAGKTLQWPEDAVLRAQKVSGPLLSKDGVLSVDALETMQTTLLEYKAQEKRVPTADLYTAEFTPVKL
jgi:NitT/TauT family transport system substrate-binding protein